MKKIRKLTCGTCLVRQSILNFSTNPSRKNGYHNQCRNCAKINHKKWYNKNRKKRIKQTEQYRKDNFERLDKKRKEHYKLNRQKYADTERANRLLRNYGISTAQYESMKEKQKNVCAICFKKETTGKIKRLRVDHCHSTGKVRGLLCNKCNIGIGFLQDSLVLLKSAMKYLKGSKKK